MEQSGIIRLLEEMTLKEKIGQLQQLPGSCFEEDFVLTGPENFMNFTEEDLILAGSVLSITGAGKLKGIQKRFMEKHPHHIPLIFMADVINGYKTIFPIPLGQGAGFNPALTEAGARVAAREASAAGIQLFFSPMADLVRDPRWGRVMESTGEDPYLNSVFARASVEGYQGKKGRDGRADLKRKGSVAACVKHFAGYGAAMAGRDYNTVELSERTLRDEYLPAYQAAVEAGVETVMTSFNLMNRIPASGNAHLMREILREEWGFDGVLISDWAAIGEMVNHRVAENEKEAALLAIRAGVDIDMCTRCYAGNLESLIEEGRVPESLVDEAVLRVLNLKNRLGLFEDPYKDADEEEEKTILLCEENRAEARKATSESFVLLKNEEILPLEDLEDAVLIGPFADSGMIYGAWSIFADKEDSVTIEEGLRKAGWKGRMAAGCVLSTDYPKVGMGGAQCYVEKDEARDEKLLNEALELAQKAGKVILTIGELNIMTGEASSRGMLDIPSMQMKLLRKVAEVNPNIITLLFTGRPLDLREIAALSKAVLVVWQPGTEGGNAVSDVLTGKESPSGKLPMSFPYCVGQVPVFYNEMSTGRHYEPGNPDQFVSRYADIPNAPLYPFGFGLSYSEFEISEVSLSGDTLRLGAGDTLQASVTVRNTGSREAKEVVQMYLRDDVSSTARPVRELKGFEKISLKPGEERKVSFTIREEMLAFTGSDDRRRAEKGSFTVYVGNSSETENSAGFILS